jgi:hypothetical protein
MLLLKYLHILTKIKDTEIGYEDAPREFKSKNNNSPLLKVNGIEY